MVDDNIWDVSDTDENMQEREYRSVYSQFVQNGYREGIAAAKDDSLQEGFDKGFKEAAALGAIFGEILGVASGANLFFTWHPEVSWNEIHSSVTSLEDQLSALSKSRIKSLSKGMSSESDNIEQLKHVLLEFIRTQLERCKTCPEKQCQFILKMVNSILQASSKSKTLLGDMLLEVFELIVPFVHGVAQNSANNSSIQVILDQINRINFEDA